MKVTVQEERVQFIEIPDEIMEQLGLKEGDSLSIEERDGSLILTPYARIEINMDEMDRASLERLIQISCEKNISCNQVIEDLLRDFIKDYE